jgi:RNA polymerase sigma-B factor
MMRSPERQLFESYQKDGDVAARDELVGRFLPLARKLARRYERGGEPFDDLFQVASMGLVKAVERFDPERHTAFSSFAVPTILGELKRHFRDSGWAAHVPRGAQELVLRVNEAADRLTTELGRSPTASELARDLGTSVEAVLEAREAALAHDAASLDAPRGAGDEDDQSWISVLGVEEGRFELIEDGMAIAPVLRALPPRERAILRLRFADDLTQAEIADRLEISQMHVSRLLRRSLARIRVVVESSERAAAA